MKNYRKVMPLLLIAFLILAIYSRVTELIDQEKQYYNYLESAREYREGKIYTDAWNQYQLALEMNPTLELCGEIAEMLLEENDDSEIRSWGNYMIETYPKEVAGYEYLINHYYINGQYNECFSVYETVEKRGLYSQALAETMNSIKYAYKVGGARYTYVSEYVGNYCVVSAEGMYGFCRENGEIILPEQYCKATVFCDDLAAIWNEKGECYFIDIEGNRRMNVSKEIAITEVGCFSESVYTAGTEGKMFYVNREGEIVLGPYEDTTAFNYERAAVKEDGLWYLIDAAGNKLTDGYLEFVMDEKEAICRNDVIFARAEEGYVCLNGQGEKVTKQIYEDARMFLDDSMAAVKLDGKWGFIDNTGSMKIEPYYEDAKSFRNGLAAVKLDGKWGYIDSEGVIAIPLEFEDVKCFNVYGFAFVKPEADKWAILELISDTYAY